MNVIAAIIALTGQKTSIAIMLGACFGLSSTAIVLEVLSRPKARPDILVVARARTGTHPDVPYRTNIIVARPGPNKTRITMFNERVTVRYATGDAERRLLKSEVEYRSVLRDEFGLNMSDDEIGACIEVVKLKGDKGAPHPFFT